jgi:hypothetical protein
VLADNRLLGCRKNCDLLVNRRETTPVFAVAAVLQLSGVMYLQIKLQMRCTARLRIALNV